MTTAITFFLCFISFSFNLFSTTNSLQGNETDRLALLAIKSQITLDPYNVMASWNGSLHFCEWEGVKCGRKHQRVTVLDLSSNALSGALSPHIGNLSFLNTLNLLNNSFNQEIPQELGKLFRLTRLVLINNSFVGEIPINITLCSNLRSLALNGNNLVGKIPSEVGSLSKLEKLGMESNKLSGGIPSSLGNLSFLEALDIARNRLSGIVPASFAQLKRLEVLSIGSNNLSGMFPLSIYNLSRLQVISAPLNNLTGNLPQEIGLMLPDLQQLYIGGNRFSGNFPVSIFNASKLGRFDIPSNQFTGNIPLSVGNLKDLQLFNLEGNYLGSGKPGDLNFFTSLANCSKLNVLSIRSNQFGGTLPSSIGNLTTELRILDLSQNLFTGNIPNEVENLQSLIYFSVDKNSITGSIPMGFSKLQQLQVLRLRYNQLSGHLPSYLKNMSQLYYLGLHNNNLEGSILPALGNQVLEYLFLHYNNFTGTIPKEIGQTSRLLELDLAHNLLNGSIPFEVGNLKDLVYLNVSENKLSGEIPSSLGSCSSLQFLSLEGNSFRGPIPPSLDACTDLQILDVSGNNLSGNIPKELEKLMALNLLNISFNNFQGEVPLEGVFQNASAFSILGNQEICGGVPKLGLPKCHTQRSRNSKWHLPFIVTIGVLVPSLIIGLLLVMYLKKKPQGRPQLEQGTIYHKRISYNDLHKATSGFSSSNLVGVGSYGSVYKGTIHQDDGPVAIKVFNLMQYGASKTFLAECDAMRVIRHRNLLNVLTVCSSVDFAGNDFKALVFKFMPNGSLDSWLHSSTNGERVSRHLSLSQRLNIATDIASALDYLHNNGERPIVHCDLKSSNVLIGDDLTAYVCDFGLSKVLSTAMQTINSSDKEISSIALKGTIGYIPPEYGMGAKVTTQGDMFSYGILMLEMFTGKRPTDHMFKDGLSLHRFSKMALPLQVMDIIDVSMLSEEIQNEGVNFTDQLKKCLCSIIEIGVACSMDAMNERMNIKEVLKELSSIRKHFCEV